MMLEIATWPLAEIIISDLEILINILMCIPCSVLGRFLAFVVTMLGNLDSQSIYLFFSIISMIL